MDQLVTIASCVSFSPPHLISKKARQAWRADPAKLLTAHGVERKSSQTQLVVQGCVLTWYNANCQVTKMLKVVQCEGDVVQSSLIGLRQVGSRIVSGEVYANADVSGMLLEVWVAQIGGYLMQGSLALLGAQSLQIHVDFKVIDTVDVTNEVLGDLLVHQVQVARRRRDTWSSDGTIEILARDQSLWHIAVDAGL